MLLSSAATRAEHFSSDDDLMALIQSRVDEGRATGIVLGVMEADGASRIVSYGDGLYAQATGQSKFQVFPESETKLFYKVVDAQITFVADDTGAITSLILHQNGGNMPASKLK